MSVQLWMNQPYWLSRCVTVKGEGVIIYESELLMYVFYVSCVRFDNVTLNADGISMTVQDDLFTIFEIILFHVQ